MVLDKKEAEEKFTQAHTEQKAMGRRNREGFEDAGLEGWSDMVNSQGMPVATGSWEFCMTWVEDSVPLSLSGSHVFAVSGFPLNSRFPTAVLHWCVSSFSTWGFWGDVIV